MGTKVIFTYDSPFGDYKASERGEVDGYMRGGDGVPRAVVVKDDGGFVMAPLNHIRVDSKPETENGKA